VVDQSVLIHLIRQTSNRYLVTAAKEIQEVGGACDTSINRRYDYKYGNNSVWGRGAWGGFTCNPKLINVGCLGSRYDKLVI
jgi:hypothetical protein